VLSGCGTHDGTDPHEAVLTLLALDRAGARVFVAAPDVPVPAVTDHQRGGEDPYEHRRVLAESARLARGSVRPIASVAAGTFDALVLPGGYGAVKVLSDHTAQGRAMRVLPELQRLLEASHARRVPIGCACTAAVVVARALGPRGVTLTVGTDPTLAADVEAFGARHRPCGPRDLVVDREHRVVSTPAYLSATRLVDLAEGLQRMVQATLELV
jgi:enhancing lycopene biosynthesis protein 2